MAIDFVPFQFLNEAIMQLLLGCFALGAEIKEGLLVDGTPQGPDFYSLARSEEWLRCAPGLAPACNLTVSLSRPGFRQAVRTGIN